VACPSGYYSGDFGILYEIKWTILKFLNQQYIVNTRDVSQFCLYLRTMVFKVVIILQF
jgi:hypothetical protein